MVLAGRSFVRISAFFTPVGLEDPFPPEDVRAGVLSRGFEVSFPPDDVRLGVLTGGLEDPFPPEDVRAGVLSRGFEFSLLPDDVRLGVLPGGLEDPFPPEDVRLGVLPCCLEDPPPPDGVRWGIRSSAARVAIGKLAIRKSVPQSVTPGLPFPDAVLFIFVGVNTPKNGVPVCERSVYIFVFKICSRYIVSVRVCLCVCVCV
jgi:hypothetical protein